MNNDKKKIKEVIIRFDGPLNEYEIKHNDVLAIKVGNFTIAPEMIEGVKNMSEYKYSCDINDMMDHLILDSFENYDDAKDTLNKIRAMFCIRDFLRRIEKGNSDIHNNNYIIH